MKVDLKNWALYIRVGLDYDEEVHQSIILGDGAICLATKWPGSSPVGVYAMAKTFIVKNFKHGWKHDVDANMTTHFTREILRRSSFLGNLESSNMKLDLWRTPTSFFVVFFFIFPSCPL